MSPGALEYRRMRIARLLEAFDLLPEEARRQELEALAELLGDGLTEGGRALLVGVTGGADASLLARLQAELVGPEECAQADPVETLVRQVLPHLSETLSHAQYVRLENFGQLSADERAQAWSLVSPYLRLPALGDWTPLISGGPAAIAPEVVWRILTGLLLLERRQPGLTRDLRQRLAGLRSRTGEYRGLLEEVLAVLTEEERVQLEGLDA